MRRLEECAADSSYARYPHLEKRYSSGAERGEFTHGGVFGVQRIARGIVFTPPAGIAFDPLSLWLYRTLQFCSAHQRHSFWDLNKQFEGPAGR